MLVELLKVKQIPKSATQQEAAVLKMMSSRFTPPAPTKANRVKAYQYVMTGHAVHCVECYLELSGKTVDSLKQVATPCIADHQLSPEQMITKGVLAPVAARIVFKVLYLARVGRMDLLWSVNVLERSHSLDCSL